jgi:hypothetical protein
LVSSTTVNNTGTVRSDIVSANTNLTSPLVSSTTINNTGTVRTNILSANTSASVPLLTVTTTLDGNTAAAFLSSLYTTNMTVGGTFIQTGATVYASNTFILSQNVASAIDSYYNVDRGPSQNSASFRWTESPKNWQIKNVTSGTYYRVHTDEYFSTALSDTSTSNIASASLANTLNNLGITATVIGQAAYNQANSAITLGQSAYGQANSAITLGQSAYGQANSAITLGQSGYTQANAAYNQANSAITLGQSGYTQANAAYNQANSAITLGQSAYGQANSAITLGQSAYGQANSAITLGQSGYTQANTALTTALAAKTTFTGTTGSPFTSNTLTFSSNNGVTIVPVGSNTVAISTSQDLRTSSSPTFSTLTLSTTPLGTGSGGSGQTSASGAFNTFITGAAGTGSSGQVLTTGGAGSYYWAAGGGGGGSVQPGTTISSFRLSYSGNNVQTVFTTPVFNQTNQLRAYINGSRQFESEYTASSVANTITFTTPPSVGDSVLIEVDGYIINPYYANNIPVTPTGTISGNTIQLAINSLESSKAALAGATFTGDVIGLTTNANTSNALFATTQYVKNVLNQTSAISGTTYAISTSGNAGTVTGGVYTSTSYADPSWITSLSATKLSLGTIPSATLGASTVYIGSTAVALNRATASLALTGILSVSMPGSSSGTLILQPAAAAGATTITLPATTGTIITTGDSATVTNAMLAGSIANAKLASSAISINSASTSLGGSVTLYAGTTTLQSSSTNQALTGISSVTLPGSTSGSVQLIPAAIAGTGTVLTMPATTGTVITTGDTGTVTNTMLAGSITTSKITGLATSATTDTTNAANIGSGTLPALRLTGSYTGITGVGTLAAGSVPTSLITGLATSATTDTTNAANIGSGTLPSARISGSYTGITGVGTLAAGSIPTSLITGLAASATTDTTNAANIGSGTLPSARLPYTMDQAVATNSNVQHNSLGIGTPASNTAGEIRATSTITAGYSDDQLKTKLGNIDNALDKLMTLNGFYYEPNQTALDLGYTLSKQVGVSAQEVQKVLPEVVVAAPIDDKYLTVQYDRMIPLLIESIKELKLEIEVLKGQIK